MNDHIFIIKPNYNRNESLLRSFRQKIYYSPIVGKCQGKLYLVDGYLRQRFGNQSDVIYISFTSMEELFKAIVTINTAGRQLHLLEKSFLITFAKEHSLELKLSSLLKTKIDEEVVLIAKRIVDLPNFYLEILQDQKLTFKHVQALFYFNSPQLAQLQKIFNNCRFSQSNFYRFLADLHHFLRINDIALEEFLKNARVLDILQKKLSAHEKGEKLLWYLSCQIRPDYHQSLEKLACIKAKLKENSLEVSYGANFEDDYCKLMFKLANKQDIKSLVKIIIDNEKNLCELLEVIRCED